MKKQAKCPYARGHDSLKMHWLWMSEKDAKEMDKRIKDAQDEPCGKDAIPGSRMCREHLKHERGYMMETKHNPYPYDGAPFTCQHSPCDYGSEKRWIIHDVNGHSCGEFDGEQKAKDTVDRWLKGGADKITIDWEAPDEDADDSDRGTYYIGLKGTNLKKVVRNGWYSMEAAADESTKLRESLLKHGLDALVEILGLKYT